MNTIIAINWARDWAVVSFTDVENVYTLNLGGVTGICGAVCGLDWETSANDYLAEYGVKLGQFDTAKGDRYKLVELGENDIREGFRI